jgi:hypothetical protein
VTTECLLVALPESNLTAATDISVVGNRIGTVLQLSQAAGIAVSAGGAVPEVSAVHR